ncbi:hypothetical protein [Seohaeicola zhoushanensis]|uniref:hypothetical protein n=1 Tax=Seohaeicola zhoushanensis TaxID=1569283 RepID=UPI001679CD0D|nr:hypothetical protein [Seohaeicola zhoushanensis]
MILKRFVAAAILGVALHMSVSSASASTVAFDSTGSSLAPGSLVVINYLDQGLVFTSAVGGLLSRVDALFELAAPTPQTVTLTLYSFGGGALGSAMDSASAVLSSGGQTLEFTGWTAALVAGQSYGLIASTPSTYSLGWDFTSDPVSGSLGRYYQFSGSPPVVQSSATPIAKVTVDPAVVPLPAGGPLIVSGMVLLFLFGKQRRRA